jgi:hypothetical protein
LTAEHPDLKWVGEAKCAEQAPNYAELRALRQLTVRRFRVIESHISPVRARLLARLRPSFGAALVEVARRVVEFAGVPRSRLPE